VRQIPGHAREHAPQALVSPVLEGEIVDNESGGVDAIRLQECRKPPGILCTGARMGPKKGPQKAKGQADGQWPVPVYLGLARRNTVIADHGEGQAEQLPGVGRICTEGVGLG
jgi:hypothetical protein